MKGGGDLEGRRGEFWMIWLLEGKRSCKGAGLQEGAKLI